MILCEHLKGKELSYLSSIVPGKWVALSKCIWVSEWIAGRGGRMKGDVIIEKIVMSPAGH